MHPKPRGINHLGRFSAIAITLLFAACAPGAGLAADCDRDGRDDTEAIQLGLVPDCDGNGVPDSCDLVASIELETVSRFGVPSTPISFTKGDFNGDGQLDFAVGHESPDRVSIHLSSGDGTFAQSFEGEVSGTPIDLVSLDFDEDGLDDLLALALRTQPDPHGINILLANEDGTLSFERELEFPQRPRLLHVDDVNDDGRPDLILGTRSQPRLLVYLHLGALELADPFELIALISFSSIATGDFDDDGHVDIVGGDFVGTDVPVLYGNGDGTFEAHRLEDRHQVPGSTHTSLADVTRDGRLELIFSDWRDNRTYVYANDDGRCVRWLFTILDVPRTDSHAALDLDGDGRLELLTSSDHEPGFLVFPLHADAEPTLLSTWLVSEEGDDPIVEDVDGDGFIDFANLDASPPSISIALGRGDATFRTGRIERRTDRTETGTTSWIGTGRIDQDLAPDAVTWSDTFKAAEIWRGDGEGRLRPWRLMEFGQLGSPRDIVLEDITGDDRLEILAPLDDEKTVGVVSIQNDEDPLEISFLIKGFTSPDSLAIADLDANGTKDLVTSSSFDHVVSISFTDETRNLSEPFDRSVGDAPIDVEIGDLDGDGRPEIVTAGIASQSLTILWNTFDEDEPLFTESLTIPLHIAPRSILLADLDRDGTAEIVVADDSPRNTITIFGQLRTRVDYRETTLGLGSFPEWLRSDDIDGDGVDDLFYGDSDEELIGILQGLGDGEFRLEASFPIGGRPSCAEFLDTDGNGTRELVTAHRLTETLSITTLRTPRQNGTDCNRNGLPDSCEIATGSSADVDEDGTPDECELDCDRNDVPDDFELEIGVHTDCNETGFPDFCEISLGLELDCNRNGLPDSCDLASGTSTDFDADGIPDDCQVDCDDDGVPDDFAISENPRIDCDRNGVPDACDIAEGRLEDCDEDGRPDSCELAVLPAWRAPFRFSEILANEPIGFELVDIDGDGVDEIITIPTGETTLEVFRNFGVSEIEKMTTISLPFVPRSFTTADFDDDGNVDLIGTHFSRFAVLLSGGEGGFGEPILHSGDSFPNDRAWPVHLDEDGNLDLVLGVLDTEGFVRVLRGLGDGTFELHRTIELPSGARSIDAADLNGDGIAEVVIGLHEPPEIRVYSNALSDNLKHRRIRLRSEADPRHLLLADWNADDLLDLTWSDSVQRTFDTHLQMVDGKFTESQTTVEIDRPVWTWVAVENPGRRPSLLISTDGGPDLHFFEPVEQFGRVRFRRRADVRVGSSRTRIAPRDLDGDGEEDLLLSDSRDLLVLRGGETGLVSWPASEPLDIAPGFVLAVDLDDDDRIDVVTCDLIGSELVITFGDGDLGNEGGGGDRLTLETSGTPTHVAAFDVDGDGRLDLITANESSSTSDLFYQIANRTFEATTLSIPTPPRRVAIAHLDTGVVPDLIYRANAEVHAFFGQGNGLFGASRELTLFWTRRNGLRARDVNGDSVTDLLVAVDDHDSGLDGIAVYLGTGGRIPPEKERLNSMFAAPYLVHTGAGIGDFTVTDFDGDEYLDFVVPHEVGRSVVVLGGDGQGNFETITSWRPRLHILSTDVADLDNDGDLDVFCRSVSGREALLIAVLADENHQLIEQRTYGTAAAMVGSALAHFDDDGWIDIVTGSNASDDLNFLMSYPQDQYLADCDDDGVLDTCEIAAGEEIDIDRDGIPDKCEPDCDGSGLPDDMEIASGDLVDCDENGISDECEIAANPKIDANGNGIPDACDVFSCRVPGDCNESGSLDISDAICIFGTLFLGSPSRYPCGDGESSDPANVALLDWQGDGNVDISDPIALLNFLFGGGPSHILGEDAEVAGCVTIDRCSELDP